MPNEDLFDEIAEEAIKKAEAVGCSKSDFMNGLRSILVTIQDRFEMERSFQSKHREDDED